MNLRYTLIMALVAVALVVFAWTQRETAPVDLAAGTPTPTPVALLEVAAEDVQEVAVSGPDGAYTLTRVAGGWEVDGQKANDMVDGVVAGLAKPTIVRELPADRKPEEYGFETASLTVTLKTAAGATHVIEVGDDTPAEPNVYVRLKDGARIVIVGQSDIMSLKDWLTTPPLAPTPTATAESTPDATGSPDASSDAATPEIDDGTLGPAGPPEPTAEATSASP